MSNVTQMTPIAEVRIPVKIDRERSLIFDMNTMALFEEKTGKFYWDTLMVLFDLQDAAYKKALAEWKKANPTATEEPKAGTIRYEYTDILRGLPMKDFLALIWAACHEYTNKGEVVHTISLLDIGRHLRPLDAIPMVAAILSGHIANSPTREEVGEAPAPAEKASAGAEKPAAEPGGEASIASLEDALA